jgi:hypothetical protein
MKILQKINSFVGWDQTLSSTIAVFIVFAIVAMIMGWKGFLVFISLFVVQGVYDLLKKRKMMKGKKYE